MMVTNITIMFLYYLLYLNYLMQLINKDHILQTERLYYSYD